MYILLIVLYVWPKLNILSNLLKHFILCLSLFLGHLYSNNFSKHMNWFIQSDEDDLLFSTKYDRRDHTHNVIYYNIEKLGGIRTITKWRLHNRRNFYQTIPVSFL